MSKYVALLSFMLLSPWFVRGQQVAVTVKAVAGVGFINPYDNEVGVDFRWRLYYNNSFRAVGGVDNVNPSIYYPLNVPVITAFNHDYLTGSFTLGVEGWEEDYCGSSDTYDHCSVFSNAGDDDDAHCAYGEGIVADLTKYHPGWYSGTDNIELFGCGPYYVKFLINYSPPPPTPPEIIIHGKAYPSVYGSYFLCQEDTSLLLKATTAIPSRFYGETFFQWEYFIEGDYTTVYTINPDHCAWEDPSTDPPPCYFLPEYNVETVPVWKSIPGQTSLSINNGQKTLSNLRSLPGLNDLTVNTSVYFRARAYANGQAGQPSLPSLVVNVSPTAPKVSTLGVSPSCPNTYTGLITLSNVKGVGDYRYNLRPGFGNTQPCDPDGNSCFSGILSGLASGNDFAITSVPSGDFTLWLSNPGGLQGACYRTFDVGVKSIPTLDIQLLQQKDVSCYGLIDGELKLGRRGGLAGFEFSLTDGNGFMGIDTTGSFKGLKAGQYRAQVTDQCHQVSDKTSLSLVLGQPVKTNGITDVINATCNSPSNGKLTVKVTEGMGQYNYFLRDASTLLYSLGPSIEASWPLSGLNPGTYRVEVRDAQRPSCTGYIETVTVLAPPLLKLDIDQAMAYPVKCNGGSDGRISLVNADLSGAYTYTLTNTSGFSRTNTTVPDFTNLVSGNYTLRMKRNQMVCQDVFTMPSGIVVGQPPLLTAQMSKKDITCFGLNNGSVSVVPGGGTGTDYSFLWEMGINGNWSTLSSTSSFLTNRGPGDYRVKVRDVNNCQIISEKMTVIEPTVFSMPSVNLVDIKCLGEKGSITPLVKGGIYPYQYYYSVNGGSTFTNFTSASLFGPGQYTVKGLDANGCAVFYPGVVSITEPPAPLTLSVQPSDYNGLAISCFGGDNGYAMVTGFGGNGAQYTGYRYAVDGGLFQTSQMFTKLKAGNHVFSLRDGRGCMVSQSMDFSQSDQKLEVQVLSRKDVICAGDKTGELSVGAMGGMSPYQFSMDGYIGQSIGTFKTLGAGSYLVQVEDANHCLSSSVVTLSSVNPPISIGHHVNDVSCFEGHDGSVELTLNGGVLPLQVQFDGLRASENSMKGLKAGTYAVAIKDGAGCVKETSIQVKQPEKALQVEMVTVPVCYGKTKGKISIKAIGGTMPYFCSMAQGFAFQHDIELDVVTGFHEVSVYDAKGCHIEKTVEVPLRDNKSEPGFLVATRQNALDTLVILDISVPKPDSVHWAFDDRAEVVSQDGGQPHIKFKEPGTYWVSMRSYFSGCAYEVKKDLTINPFDPKSSKARHDVHYRSIQQVKVAPNPNNGKFNVSVILNGEHQGLLILFDMMGNVHYQNKWEPGKEIDQDLFLGEVSSGVYVLRVITERDVQDVRVMISR